MDRLFARLVLYVDELGGARHAARRWAAVAIPAILAAIGPPRALGAAVGRHMLGIG